MAWSWKIRVSGWKSLIGEIKACSLSLNSFLIWRTVVLSNSSFLSPKVVQISNLKVLNFLSLSTNRSPLTYWANSQFSPKHRSSSFFQIASISGPVSPCISRQKFPPILLSLSSHVGWMSFLKRSSLSAVCSDVFFFGISLYDSPSSFVLK